MHVLALTKFNAKICNSCSIFDSNSAPDAAAINLVYYNAVMKNVTFINHIGSTMRVSNYSKHCILHSLIHLNHKGDYWKS